MRSLILVLVAVLASPSLAAVSDPLTLHVLDCGELGMDTERFLPGVQERPERFDMTDRCFLIVHPDGTLLWDAGLPVSFRFELMSWALWLFTFGGIDANAGVPLVDQLAELGMSPADVDYVAFSHVHFDHVGQADAFAASTWLVQQVEHDFVFDPELDNESVFVGLVEPMRDSKTILLDGDHDVFGDGRVVILSAPGHTPGHQCLFVDLPQTGAVVLSGDLYHSELNRELRVPPSFNTDRDETKRSMERIEGFIAERGAELWIQHVKGSGPMAPATLH